MPWIRLCKWSKSVAMITRAKFFTHVQHVETEENGAMNQAVQPTESPYITLTTAYGPPSEASADPRQRAPTTTRHIVGDRSATALC